jgi:hypothetical protein
MIIRQFTNTIHGRISESDIARHVAGEPLIQPCNRTGFALSTDPPQFIGEVVGDNQIDSIIFQTLELGVALNIFER